MKRVVVTGIGALTPIGNSVDAYLKALQEGVSGTNPITRFNAEAFKTRFACELKDLDITEVLDKKEVRKLDLFAQYALYTTHEAIAMSGLTEDILATDRTGVIWGSGIGGLRSLEAEIETYAEAGRGVPRHSPFLIPKMIADIAAGHISIRYGCLGINYATVSACASANHAIINAFDYIRLGKADVFITGGSEAAITETGMGGFSNMKALSERNDDYLTASRPFDADRDGFVLGEGSGTLILEDYDHARRRGAPILAEIIGTGATADAYHITAPHPEGRGASIVMRTALKEAGINTSDVDYINVHGTSTPLGDVAELRAIQHVFGEDAYGLNISSTKSMTGHLLGASGAIEAVAGILGMKHNFVPPTINHFTPDPEIDPKLNLTLNQPQERHLDIILSNTFGFGGHNSSIALKRV